MEDEEDLYACVYEDEEGGEIYEDLMKTEAIPPPVCAPSVTSISDPDCKTVSKAAAQSQKLLFVHPPIINDKSITLMMFIWGFTASYCSFCSKSD